MFRGRAERKVRDAGYDPARLPPGQYFTEKWPVLHAGSIPRTDLATWDFFVEGEVENPIRISWDELNALPRTSHTQDIHCVTRWSRFDVTFEGVHWSALEPLVQPKPSARYVVAHAEEGYTTNVPIAFLRDPLSLLATHADGEPLTPEHGGPLRLVIPHKYFWKSAKWLRGLELTGERPPGLLGALWLPQRRRPLQRRALRLLNDNVVSALITKRRSAAGGRLARPGGPLPLHPCTGEERGHAGGNIVSLRE